MHEFHSSIMESSTLPYQANASRGTVQITQRSQLQTVSTRTHQIYLNIFSDIDQGTPKSSFLFPCIPSFIQKAIILICSLIHELSSRRPDVIIIIVVADIPGGCFSHTHSYSTLSSSTGNNDVAYDSRGPERGHSADTHILYGQIIWMYLNWIFPATPASKTGEWRKL